MSFSLQKSITDLDISFNSNGWGPVSGEKTSTFGNIPYLHFDKKEKLGRPADFTQNTLATPRMQRTNRFRGDDYISGEFVYRHDATEDSTFQLVDNTAKTSKRKSFSSSY